MLQVDVVQAIVDFALQLRPPSHVPWIAATVRSRPRPRPKQADVPAVRGNMPRLAAIARNALKVGKAL